MTPDSLEFFVPSTKNAKVADQAWETVRTLVADRTVAITEQRVFRVGYLHDGKQMAAEVGQPHPDALAVDWKALEEIGEPEEVLLIFERSDGVFVVCTPSRGVEEGDPILVEGGEVNEVVYFDGYGP